MTKRTFSRDFLRDVVQDDAEGAKVVHDEIVDHRRWVVRHRTVFAFDGKHYETYYDRGATEMQDVTPFEGEPDQIEVDEVELVEVVTHEWRAVQK